MAREFLVSAPDLQIRAISHTEIEDEAHRSDVDCVVNFSFSPSLHVSDYHQSADIDLHLANFAVKHQCHYVMLSSRKVYQADIQWGAREEAQTQGADVYGKNKLRIERELLSLLRDRLTILRPGNVFGYETQRNRKRFGAYLLNQLVTSGDIHLTVNPFIRRDVVPVDFFNEVLRSVLLRRPVGVFNVGAGEAVEIGRVAIWLIQGFGSGRLIVDSPTEMDEFWLDSSRLAAELGMYCGAARVAEFTKAIGARLRAEVSSGKSTDR